MNFGEFDINNQCRYTPVSANGMTVSSETIDPEKLMYRLEYGNSQMYHEKAILNGLKRALLAIEHYYYDTKGRIKKLKLIYTDGFESYREFDERGRLVVEDNSKERVEFLYEGSSLKGIVMTRPNSFTFISKEKATYTIHQLNDVKRIVKDYPWAVCFHQFNPFDKDNKAHCSVYRAAQSAMDNDQAILPTEFVMGSL